MDSKKIFDSQSDNGYSLEFTASKGSPFVKISGTWDSCTIKLQAKTNHADDSFSETGADEEFTSKGKDRLNS